MGLFDSLFGRKSSPQGAVAVSANIINPEDTIEHWRRQCFILKKRK